MISCSVLMYILCWSSFLQILITNGNEERAMPLQKEQQASLSQKQRTSQTKYEPTWESLDSRPLPKWYDQDKFGIFIHWGVFSVPAMSEWFWYHWKGAKSETAEKFMKDNFKPHFSYQDFAKDFTAELYNATEWALIFNQSKAKYVVLTSKHHEGFTLWPSKYSFSWNSMDVGPHKDLLGELATAIRKNTNIKFGLYHSLYEWFNPLYLEDKKLNLTTRRFVDFKTGPELYELVQLYNPEIVWSDGEWEAPDDYWKAKEFLTWLYNESPIKDTVVTNDRWGSNTLCKHGGFLTCRDRFNPGTLQKRKWENAMTINKYTWGYLKGNNDDDYYTSQELIHTLVVTISCGGNLLLNVGPTKEGKIIPIEQERLRDIGKWLSTNGEGIFETTPWIVCRNDTATPNIWYTVRNSDKANPTIYATFLTWPKSGKLVMNCVQSLKPTAKVHLVENELEVQWSSSEISTQVSLPDKRLVDTNWAWMIKIINDTETEQ